MADSDLSHVLYTSAIKMTFQNSLVNCFVFFASLEGRVEAIEEELLLAKVRAKKAEDEVGRVQKQSRDTEAKAACLEKLVAKYSSSASARKSGGGGGAGEQGAGSTLEGFFTARSLSLFGS